MTRRHRLRWILVFGLGVVLRLALWSGYGLGDDPNYFTAYYGIYTRGGAFDPHDPYQMRFGLWVPVVLAMRLFGPTEAGFVGAITICSIINLVLIYLLARQEWERPYALLAMLLLAVCPLEVLCSGLFANDVVLATYCFAALWLFRRSLRDEMSASARFASAAASGVLLFFGFATKPWVALTAPLFVIEAIARVRRHWRSSLVAVGVLATLVGAFLAWQWRRFGDPLYHVNVARPFAIFEPYSRPVLLAYPRMLFEVNEYGSYFAGYYPHVLVLLAVLLVGRFFRAGKWLVYASIMLAGLMALPGGRQNGLWGVLPQIFRYLALLPIPMCMALAAYWRELLGRRLEAAVVWLPLFVILSVLQCVAVTEPTRDAYSEQRRAIAFLRNYPDDPVAMDASFRGRFIYFELGFTHFERLRSIAGEHPAERAREYAAMTDGMVVTGGARNPWYNCFPCLGYLDNFTVPPTWSLEATLPGRRTRYRPEPLRIWRVSADAVKAKALLDERPGWSARRELLTGLLDRGDDALAAEVGQHLLADPATPARGEITLQTGIACLRAEKLPCAARLLPQAFASGLAEPQLRDAIVALALLEQQRHDFVKAREWIAELRRRFPESSVDSRLEEIESGLADGMYWYRLGELQSARSIFGGLARPETKKPEIRRRARYWFALTLFRMGLVDDGRREAVAYRDDYGEDPSWIEIQYRYGEALLAKDPESARAVFDELVAKYPESSWGREAGSRLQELGGAPSDASCSAP
jgi:tetratricopeptide (TPR) repeat protein